MNVLCFVLMVGWNQNIASVEMYIFSVNYSAHDLLKYMHGMVIFGGMRQLHFQGQPMFNY